MEMMQSKGALVLFSGGFVFLSCVVWVLLHYAKVETIGFDYGQRHAIELSVRPALLQQLHGLSPDWAARLGEDHMIDLSLLSRISDTALTRNVEIAMQDNGLPHTFVPGRNLLFMTVAAALAYRRGLDVLVGCKNKTKKTNKPNNRHDTKQSLQETLNLGMDSHFTVDTPLMWLDKAD